MKKYELTEDIVVLYVPAESFPEGIQPAFDKLEDRLSSKNNRALFGISWPDQQGKIHYKAAAGEKYDGEGKINELDTFTIKKGTYMHGQTGSGYKRLISYRQCQLKLTLKIV